MNALNVVIVQEPDTLSIALLSDTTQAQRVTQRLQELGKVVTRVTALPDVLPWDLNGPLAWQADPFNDLACREHLRWHELPYKFGQCDLCPVRETCPELEIPEQGRAFILVQNDPYWPNGPRWQAVTWPGAEPAERVAHYGEITVLSVPLTQADAWATALQSFLVVDTLFCEGLQAAMSLAWKITQKKE